MDAVVNEDIDRVRAIADYVRTARDPRAAFGQLIDDDKAEVIDQLDVGRRFQRYMAVTWLMVAIVFPLFLGAYPEAMPSLLAAAIIVISATLAVLSLGKWISRRRVLRVLSEVDDR